MNKMTSTDKKRFKIWPMIFLFLFAPLTGMGQNQPLDELIQKARDAGIEQARIDDLQNRAANRGMSDEQLAMILEPAVALAEQNLPSDMIFQKAMEGIAKGVPGERMAPVLQNIRQGTESVVPVVNDWVDRESVGRMIAQSGEQFDRESFREQLMNVSAKAVSQQVGLDLVQDILNAMDEEGVMNRSKPSSVIAAVNIMPDIPAMHERPEDVKGLVVRAVQGGFSASEIQRLPGAMNMAQRRSQLPAAAVIQGVAEQMRADIPAVEILQNLFDGKVGGGPPGGVPPGLINNPGRRLGQGQGQGN
jgi:hypothetical protein